MEKTKKTKDQGHRHWELASEIRQARRHDLHSTMMGYPVKHNVAEKIETSASATGSLTIVEGCQEDRVTGEDDSLARHVQTQCQRAGCDHRSQKALSEKHLHTLITRQ